MTITDFLLARIADDETVARELRPHEHLDTRDSVALRSGQPGNYATISITSTRVLAECASKRAILEAHEEATQRKDIYNRGHDEGQLATAKDLRSRLDANVRWRALDDTLRSLASVYADHPDYDAGWAL